MIILDEVGIKVIVWDNVFCFSSWDEEMGILILVENN